MDQRLVDHGKTSAELAQAIRELSDLRQASARAYTSAWRETAHLNVTERRETCKAHSAEFDAQALVVEGEVAALRVELNHLEFVIRYDRDQN